MLLLTDSLMTKYLSMKIGIECLILISYRYFKSCVSYTFIHTLILYSESVTRIGKFVFFC